MCECGYNDNFRNEYIFKKFTTTFIIFFKNINLYCTFLIKYDLHIYRL